MGKKRESFFLSYNPEDIIKGKATQPVIHPPLPLMSGINKDETDDRDNSGYVTGYRMSEKRFDGLQGRKSAEPSGEDCVINYSTPTYSSKENFETQNQSKFDSVIGYSFDFEGGYTNRKEDKETNYGITKPFLDNYKYALAGGESKSISELTKDDARLLYKAQWDRYRLGYVRDKEVALLLNDYMINSNAKKVAERVQNILNSNGANLKIDGVFGKQTLNAIHNTDKDWLVEQILIDRLKRYQFTLDREPYKKIFIPGWIARLNKLAEYSKANIRFREADLKVK